jgi:hypothetical protein
MPGAHFVETARQIFAVEKCPGKRRYAGTTTSRMASSASRRKRTLSASLIDSGKTRQRL